MHTAETTNTPNDEQDPWCKDEQDPWCKLWSEAGALVIREHQGKTPEGELALSAPTPADLDPKAIDEGFTTFATRFMRRQGHVALGLIFTMAEAWGLSVQGDFALCDAADPDLIIWQKSSLAYLSNLVYLIQHDPDNLVLHTASEQEASQGAIYPSTPVADADRYNKRQGQGVPRWLPTVFCAEREGIGQHVSRIGMMTIDATMLADAAGGGLAGLRALFEQAVSPETSASESDDFQA